MKLILLVLISMSTFSVTPQTKWIEFKSHSGNPENLKIAMETPLFNAGNSNFGAAPDRVIRSAALDSVIFISDSVSLMITSIYCTRIYDSKQNFWRAGNDTVRNHALFSRKHSLDSIKKILKQEYNFQNNINNVKFIGYDNGQHDSIIYEEEPTDPRITSQPEQWLQGGYPWMIGAIFSCSLLAGFIARMLNKPSAEL